MSLKVLLMAMSMAAGSTFGIVAQSAAVVDVLKEVKAEYAPDTRVAMYVGGGKYIHSSGRVKVNSMDPKADD